MFYDPHWHNPHLAETFRRLRSVQNNSGKWYMLDKAGNVIEGESNPAAVSVLAAPGANIPADIVAKYDLKARLEGEAPQAVDAAGRPVVVLESGSSVSVDALPHDHPARVEAEKRSAAKLTDKPVAKPVGVQVNPPTKPGG